MHTARTLGSIAVIVISVLITVAARFNPRRCFDEYMVWIPSLGVGTEIWIAYETNGTRWFRGQAGMRKIVFSPEKLPSKPSLNFPVLVITDEMSTWQNVRFYADSELKQVLQFHGYHRET